MYEPIIGTLGYVLSPERTHVLLVQRTARAHDHHLGKFNGLGGKLKPDEDVLSGLTREIREEAGIECEEVRLRGTINWTGFGPGGENWLGFIFLVPRYSGTPFSVNEEGKLGWHALDSLHTLPMWEGDRFFLPLVFDDDPRIFYGHMPYRDGHPIDWHYRRA
jgi:8-oxo-dGTP diphosphatase